MPEASREGAAFKEPYPKRPQGAREDEMPKIGVLLSGCGNIDGGEIHESTLTLLYLDQAGADYFIFAPDVPFEVVNYLTKKPTGETRSVLLEAARIARGDITDIKNVKADDMDALIIPGGSGLAKNLCDFAAKGPKATVNPDAARLIRDIHAAGKPQGAICIAPVLPALVLGAYKPRLTIGSDMGTAQAIETCGATHVNCAVDEICVDEKNKIVTTPAYMLGPSIKDIAKGIKKLVDAIVAMA